MTARRILAGASGYSFKEWKGPFYPAACKPDQMLPFYASKLSTAGAFAAPPSYSHGGYTQKYTDCSDVAGQDEALAGTVPNSTDLQETLANKGESHVLAQSVTEGQNSEDGARCRFRTYDPYRVKVMLYH